MRDIREQIGMEAFNAAWDAVVGEPQPDWLQDDGDAGGDS
jgi:hypothetical protein